ncbi:hypothetical protein Ocin01_20238, partial [Orchesella cincta]
ASIRLRFGSCPPKQRRYEARTDLLKNNEIFNTEEQSKIRSPKAILHQMEISQASQPPKGLLFQTIDGGYSDLLLKKLEGNYMNSRRLVFLSNGHSLMTPMKFLRFLCENMEIGIHVEKFRFWLGPAIGVQHRTEIFAGRFCGVAQAELSVLSAQLAAANVLERMWNYFKIPGFDSKYAVFPGPRFRCICKVKNEQTVGTNEFLHIIFSLHYVGCGNVQASYRSDERKRSTISRRPTPGLFCGWGECPTLTQIFGERGLIPNPPEGNKREWMLENNVIDADIDSCLHDPSNSSSYLDNNGIWVSANAKLEYKMNLEEAAKKVSPSSKQEYPQRKHPM